MTTTNKDLDFITNLLGADSVKVAETTTEQTTEQTEDVEATQETEQETITSETTEQTEQTETTETTEKQTTEQTETETINYDDVIREKLGYNSVDDFLKSDSISKIKEFDTLTERIKQLELENEEIITEASSLNNPFANEQLFKLNHLLKENPNLDIATASRLLSSDIKSMDNIEKIKLSIQLENPEFTDRHINRKLKSMFGVEDVADLYDAEIDGDIKLDIDIAAKDAAKRLEKFSVPADLKYEATFVPDKIKEKVSEKQKTVEVSSEEIERIWSPVVAEIESKLNELPIPSFDSKENKTIEGYTKYVLSKEDKKFAADYTSNIVQQNKIKEVTPEITNAINYEIWKELIARNLHRISQTVADKARSDEFARLKALRDGVDTNRPKDKSDKGAVNRNGIEVLLNAPVKYHSGVKR